MLPIDRVYRDAARGAVIAAGVAATMTLFLGTMAAAMPEPEPLGPNGLPVDSSTVPNEWPMYNKGYNGQRYSELRDVTPQTAQNLKEVCRVPLLALGAFQSGPVVIDGTIYVTAGRRTVAVNARDCAVRWMHDYQPEQSEAVPTNRGVAVLNGKIFRGTGDARLLALDALTGKVIWKNVVGDPVMGETLTGAPMAWNGLVFVGLAGGDLGIRGRITAFDAATGREVWRFNTVPREDEPGAKTWQQPEAAKQGGGGGGTWSSFALDPSTAELFIPVGNPAPAYAPAYRPGDNLYTNSVLVLDARTGALKWWYQLSPNDGRDLDLAAAPILYYDSQQRSVLAFAGKNGYVHGVDRKTHKLLFRTAVTTIENEGKVPTPAGVHFCPGIVGGTEWNGPALDPERKLLYVGAVDLCNTIKSEPPQYRVGNVYWGGSWTSDETGTGWITAVDQDTGAVRWRYNAGTPVISALTPTAGGVLFAGTTGGDFLVLDSATGAVLRKIPAGGGMAGGIVTYQLDRKQYVAFASGNLSRIMLSTIGEPTLVILRADAPLAPGTAADTAHGKSLYDSVCATCHGPNGSALAGHSLQNLKARLTLEQTIKKIEEPNAPMPKLYPNPLSARDVLDIATYLRTGL
jgi:alcohol dehydrogenase (cytochrome c)